MCRRLVLVFLITACVAQALGGKAGTVSAENCPRELRRLQEQNAELVVRLRNATDYIEQFTREFNNFFNEMSATRKPAAAAPRPPARRA